MPGVDKAAILLLTLGPEAAAGVFRHLSEAEVRQVSAAIARLRAIPRAQAAAVHEEAWRRLTEGDGLLVDGERFARQMIAAASMGVVREEPGDRRPGAAGAEALATSLEPIASPMVAQVLAGEHPQVMALVLANLPPRKAADILAALPEAVQADVVQRIVDLQSVADDLLAEVGDVLAGEVHGLGRAAQGPQFVGAKLAAEIMNVADEALEQRVFARLDADAPAVAETVRTLMVTFEDLARLDDHGMQTLLKEVGRDDLMLALRTATAGMRDKVLRNLSQRGGELLQEDMAALGPVRLKDVERAQAAVVAIARHLDAEERIALGSRGEDVVV
ncbi:MAG TPA: flagellar motor switch protein FliG [Candidatus Binatia bacterium]|nr:flagellar motor switch protein FliG [Candidatus Binatia bacterium]